MPPTTDLHPDKCSFVKTTVTIPRQRIIDMIITAVEGGSNYWLDSVACFGGDGSRKAWLDSVACFGGDGSRKAWSELDDVTSLIFTEQPDGEGPHEISLTDLAPASKIGLGLQVMADTYPKHFANLLTEDDDAETADVFLQCVCLGEVAYS